MAENPTIVQVVQEAIDKGARTVEEVHLSVASMPIQALRSLGASGEAADRTQDVLESSIGTVYDTILAVNRRVADIAAGLLASAQARQDDA
jgi:hypothetical protein